MNRETMGRHSTKFVMACMVGLFTLVVGCRQDMHDQPKYEPLEASQFFEDGRSARPLVPDTVARGHLKVDEHLYKGKSGEAHASTFPFPVTQQIFERGKERYTIFCSPCHDRVGTGQGMVVRRGYTRPNSFHTDRLRQAPPGYFYDAITNGFGVMPAYAAQIPVRDRWAIVAYIRALQLSQRAVLTDVPSEERAKLEGAEQ
ncbi:MAG: c-type cytochrome [Candidatus Methylomirabilales bacterium]